MIKRQSCSVCFFLQSSAKRLLPGCVIRGRSRWRVHATYRKRLFAEFLIKRGKIMLPPLLSVCISGYLSSRRHVPTTKSDSAASQSPSSSDIRCIASIFSHHSTVSHKELGCEVARSREISQSKEGFPCELSSYSVHLRSNASQTHCACYGELPSASLPSALASVLRREYYPIHTNSVSYANFIMRPSSLAT